MLPFLISKFLLLFVSFVIVIDSGEGEKEKEITQEICPKLKETLIKNQICDVILTSGSISQIERTNMINQSKADCFLSLHLNSCISNQASGFEIFYSSKLDSNYKIPLQLELVQTKYYKNSKALANMILISLDEEFNSLIDARWNTNIRGITEADLLPLKGIAMPAVLIELGFLTNEAESAKIKDPIWLEKVSNAISKAILNYMDKYEK